MDTILQYLKYITPTVIFPIVLFSGIIIFFLNYLRARRIPGPDNAPTVTESAEKPVFTLVGKVRRMSKRDKIIMLAITAVYAAVAFWGLGDTKDPQTFCHFEGPENYSITLTLDEPRAISKVMYYTGLYTGEYELRWSSDGEKWSDTVEMPQEYSRLFNWITADVNSSAPVKYIKILAGYTPLEMGEVALYGNDGKAIPAGQIKYSGGEASKLFDEQNLVPNDPSYMNSMYFDEIYHGRTAYEFIKNVYPYENTHPPLGKVIISLGIQIFGMTPFGWRFMGTLFGVLMLPFMYAFLKRLFGRTLIAACGTVLFAFDFMHFVQTRIATIDTYGVFFILAMFYFMYIYISQDYETPFKKTMAPLFLSGLFFGIGAASKWIVLYGAAGLAVLWLLRQIFRGRHYIKLGLKEEFIKYAVKTTLLSVLAFIVIPGIIYALSYIPFGTASDMTISSGMLWDKNYYSIIIENQKYMFNYHSTLVATHPYSSPWFSWLLDIRPILYYLKYLPDGYKSAFGAFGNPIVWWGGLVALFYTGWQFFKTRDFKALFIVLGYLTQLLPWVGVTRIVFIYHYFPSTVFLVLAICYAFNRMYQIKIGYYRLAIAGYTAASVVLFIAFYPVLTGVAAPQWYTTNFLQWIPSAWPF